MKSKKPTPSKAPSKLSFSKFISDPMIAGAFLVFAFIALMFALQQFLAARGY